MSMNPDKAASFIRRQMASGSLTVYDLARIVERAQLAMGLEPDGMPGAVTLARLDGHMVESEFTPVEGVPIVPMMGAARRARALERARSMVGRGKYHLGSGGKDPKAADPFDADGTCDSSGFQAWCFELPRESDEGVWFYTDALEADARGQVKGDLGDGVPWEQAQPGDLVVYGAGPKTGHVGMISAVNNLGPTAAIHCRSGSLPAVVETGVLHFKARSAVILRLR